MTRGQVIDLLRAADPVSERISDPGGFPSMTALLDRIDERSTTVQTHERPRTEQTDPRDRRPRWLIPALAGAAAVVLAIVVGALLLAGGSDEPDVIEPTPTTAGSTTTLPEANTPLEIGAELSAATGAGDWASVRELYATDATFSVELGEAYGGSNALVDVPLDGPLPPGRPIGVSYPTLNSFDWDADGVITGFDEVAANTATA